MTAITMIVRVIWLQPFATPNTPSKDKLGAHLLGNMSLTPRSGCSSSLPSPSCRASS